MRLVINEGETHLLSKPNPAVFGVLPRLEGKRRWADGQKLVVQTTDHNIRLLSGLRGVSVEDKRGQSPTEPAEKWVEAFDTGRPTYKPKTQPYDHQKRAIEKFKGSTAYALFMEQGTGKTKTELDLTGILFCAGLITGVLVVSKKGAHAQWIKSEFPAHFNCEWEGVAWPFNKFPEHLLETTGPLKVLAFNWDGIKFARGMAAAEKFCKAHKGKLKIISDESQEMKNYRSKRHKALTEMKKYSSHRALLTGTPVGVSLEDEWAQLKWLDEDILGIRYVTTFRAEFCVMGGYEGKQIVAHKNIDTFRELTAPHVFVATKDELGLPPKVYGEWVFDLSKIQIEAARDLKSDMETVLASGEEIRIDTPVAYATKFQQICSGFIMDDGEIHHLMPIDKNPRVLAMLEWLENREGKAIIWARFKQDHAFITEALGGIGETFVEYHGGTSDKKRAEAIESFMSPDGARILDANVVSAGTGLNLQGQCHLNLYYTNSSSGIDRWQSEDRTHRIGTKASVLYEDLIANRGPDRKIRQSHHRKAGVADAAIGGLDGSARSAMEFVQDMFGDI